MKEVRKIRQAVGRRRRQERVKEKLDWRRQQEEIKKGGKRTGEKARGSEKKRTKKTRT